MSVLCGSEAQHMHLGERSSFLSEEGDRAANGPVQKREGINSLGNTYWTLLPYLLEPWKADTAMVHWGGAST